MIGKRNGMGYSCIRLYFDSIEYQHIQPQPVYDIEQLHHRADLKCK